MRTARDVKQQEIKELRGQASKLLGFMSDGAWHSQQELEEWGGMRYSARLFELAKRGHLWEKRCVRARVYTYRLLRKPQLTLF